MEHERFSYRSISEIEAKLKELGSGIPLSGIFPSLTGRFPFAGGRLATG